MGIVIHAVRRSREDLDPRNMAIAICYFLPLMKLGANILLSYQNCFFAIPFFSPRGS